MFYLKMADGLTTDGLTTDGRTQTTLNKKGGREEGAALNGTYLLTYCTYSTMFI